MKRLKSLLLSFPEFAYLSALIFFMMFFAFVAQLSSCSPQPLSPAEMKDVSEHEWKLRQCRAVGRDAQSMDAYEACKEEAGL